MRILVIESDPEKSHEAESALTDAGHEVVRCSEPGAPAFPCVGIAHDACPLDDDVDAVLDVRARPHPRPTAGETGASCALREGVPLVVAGSHGLSPFAPWATQTVEDGDDLVAAVESASAMAPPVVAEAAVAEARRLLGDDADVRVHRQGGRLSLELIAPGRENDTSLAAVAVKVLGVARQASRRATTMDIAVTPGDRRAGQ